MARARYSSDPIFTIEILKSQLADKCTKDKNCKADFRESLLDGGWLELGNHAIKYLHAQRGCRAARGMHIYTNI